MRDSIWTDELTDRATEMWRRGEFARDIADELGLPFTKDSVIGKMNRLGVVHGISRPRPKPTSARVPDIPLSSLFDKYPRVNILDLDIFKHCRAVVDERCPDLGLKMYCAQPKLEASSYCAECSAKFEKPQ